jgi:hypothetical protein
MRRISTSRRRKPEKSQSLPPLPTTAQAQRPTYIESMEELLSGIAAYLIGLPDSAAADELTLIFHSMLEDVRDLEKEVAS